MPIIETISSEEVIEQINSITIDCITSNRTNRRLTFNFGHSIGRKDKCSMEIINDCGTKTCILTFDFKGYELSIV